MEGFCCEATVVTYTYDTRGNILSKTTTDADGVETTVTYAYTDTVWADRLTNYGGTTINYDEIGNPLNWTNNAVLSWQHGRQLASFNRGVYRVSYGYNQDGIRTLKIFNGMEYHYTVVDGTLRRMTAGGNTLEFINGTSVIFNGTEYWYVFNAQNDVIGIIDANGTYVVEYTYDAWGKILSKTGTMASTLGYLNPFRYRGYIYDEETGLYYCQTRYYDPVVGRWLNADGYLYTGLTLVEHNMYAYCKNNPIMLVDGTGMCPRYYDPFTCPICNHERVRLEHGYEIKDESNPNVMSLDGGLFRYYLKESESIITHLSEEEADNIIESIRDKEATKEFYVDCCVDLLALAIPGSKAVKGVIAAMTYADNVVDIIKTDPKIKIPHQQPYFTYVETYVSVNNPNDIKIVTRTISLNGESILHDTGTIYPLSVYRRMIW